MKNSKKASLFYVLFLISLFFTGMDVSAESRVQERKWSFAFDDCPVSEALGQIVKDTKKEIFLKGETTNKVDRSYENQGLEEIIRDILRNENYILAMFPGDDDIGSLKIWLLGKGDHVANSGLTTFSKNRGASFRNNAPYEHRATFSQRHSQNNRKKEFSFRSPKAQSPPEPEQRLGLEPPPMPPGVPVPGR